MEIVCLDLEGVLIPEIWIAFAAKTGLKELKLTTRDISDYNELMNKRIGILSENGYTLTDIQKVIAELSPLPGAKAFLEKLREKTQVIILSDTFVEFCKPLIKQLGWPTVFCNSLEVDDNQMITGFNLRQKDGKKKAVIALRSMGCSIIAAGDSYNDLTMIKEAEAGVLFRAPEQIKEDHPEIPMTTTYGGLFSELEKAIAKLNQV